MLPDWLPLGLSPLTYFVRGVRAVTHTQDASSGVVLSALPSTSPSFNLGVLAAVALVAFAAAAALLPRTD